MIIIHNHSHSHSHSHEHNKVEENIFIAFILNITFSIIELFGGILTSSVAIISDAVHDAGDALSIGLSYFFEKKSNKDSDKNYTFGYRRYSILGAFITTAIILIGASFVIYNSIIRLFNPVEVNYNGMILLAIFGVVINFLAAYCTKDGESLNQKAVNLHMLEDVLGWVVVLMGSVVIKYTKFYYLDSLMSIGISIFLIIESIKSIKNILDLVLEKVPKGISVEDVIKKVSDIDGINDVHHIHIWSLDGEKNFATMHVVTDKNVKEEIREELKKLGISNTTIEIESTKEVCHHKKCH